MAVAIAGKFLGGSGCEEPRISVIFGGAALGWLWDAQCTSQSDCERVATSAEING